MIGESEIEALKFAGFVIIVVIVLVLLMMGSTVTANINQCGNLAELNPDRHFEWRFFGGCYMQTQDGLWIQVGDVIVLDRPINGAK